MFAVAMTSQAPIRQVARLRSCRFLPISATLLMAVVAEEDGTGRKAVVAILISSR